MAIQHDYIPAKQQEFNSWQSSFMEVLYQHQKDWQIPEAAVRELDDLQAIYSAAYAVGNKILLSSRTNVQASQLKKATMDYEAVLRRFIANHIRFNPFVSDSGKVALAVTVPDRTRTPRGTPVTIPFVSTMGVKGARVKIFVEQEPGKEGTSRRGKPKDAARIEVAVFVGEDAPSNPDLFPQKSQWGRSPVMINFNSDQAGSFVIIYARFVGYNNIGGHWSARHREIIPL